MINLLIVEDQQTILQLLKLYLEQEPNLKIVAVASDGQVAIEKVDRHRPDVVLMDVEMPGIDGITATRIISERYPETKVLILSTHDDEQILNQALQAGAQGYILKTTPPKELIEFIRSVHQGYMKLGSGLVQHIPDKHEPVKNTYSNKINHQKLPLLPTPRSPYFWLGIILNSIVWLLVVVYWKVVPPTYASEWGIKILESDTGVKINLPGVGGASSGGSSSGKSRQDPRTDYLYIAGDRTLLEQAAESMSITPSDFGHPEITVNDDGTIISLLMEGGTPVEAQQKAYTFHQTLSARIENLRQQEIERQEKHIQETLEASRQKLKDAQENLSRYQVSAPITSDEQTKKLASNLEDLYRQKAELSAQERGLNSISQELGRELNLSSKQTSFAYQLLGDEEYQLQLKQHAQTKSELTALLSRFTSQNPSVINKQAELNESTNALRKRASFLLNRQIGQRELDQITYLTLDPKIKTVKESILRDLVSNQANQQKLSAQIQELERQKEKLEGRQKIIAQDKLQMDNYQRDLQVAETIFATTLAELDLGKEHAYTVYPPIQLVKEPSLPKENKPTSPNLKLLLLAGMAGSFLVTTGLMLIWFERQPYLLEAPISRKQISSANLDSK